MRNKKNIERFFKESFKEFEAEPNDIVWENLEKRLLEKQNNNKKPIPVWYKYAGVAALILLFFVIGSTYLNTNKSNPKDTIVDTESNEGNKNIDSRNLNELEINLENNNTIVNSENLNEKKNENEEHSLSKNINPNSLNPLEIARDNFNSEKTNNHPFDANANSNAKNSINSSIVLNSNASTDVESNPKKLNQTTSRNNNVILINRDNKENTKSNHNTKELSTSNNYAVGSNTKVLLNNLRNNEELIKTAHTDLINAIIKQDSLKLAQAISKNEDSIEKEKLVNRWQVYANIAPVYYNTLGSGSHIHEQFNNNRKNGEVNTSYGVNVGYALSDKITLRSGINSLNLSYDTANVLLYENVSGSNSSADEYRNISFSNAVGNSLNIISSTNLQVQQVSPFLGSSVSDAAISQRISYFEVPLEIQYDVIERKFNLQLIGGFSTFFLNDNEIYTEIYNTRNYIGKANNINNVSFSTNFGIGLGYNFSDAFKFNFEPTFKYQLNAFSDTAGNFRPYIVGIYTGFSYKF